MERMSEKRKQILQMVEEGKLSVDEALTLLNSLEKDSANDSSYATPDKAELSPYVGGKQKKTYASKSSQSSLKEKLFTFVDQTVKKVKEGDLDFNFGPSIDVQHIFQQSEAYIQEIDVDLANGSVQLRPWGSTEVRIECEAAIYKVENSDEARRTFLQHTAFSIENGKLRFAIQQKQMKVKAIIYIPEMEYERVKLRMFNGSIDGERLSVRDLKAKTANGTIRFYDVNSHSLEMETSNGHMELSRILASKCELETINGMVKFDGDTKKIDVQTFNGDIDTYLKGERIEKAFFKTTTGSITLYTPPHLSVDGDLKSNFGNFTCTLPEMEIVDEKKETVMKQLRFKANIASPKGYKLLAESKTGSIVIK